MGLQPLASEADVRTRYKKLAMLYHPDKNSSHFAVAEMSKINNAKDRIDAIFEAKRIEDAPIESGRYTSQADFFQACEEVFWSTFYGYHSFPTSYAAEHTDTGNPWPRRTGVWTPGSSYQNTQRQQEEPERARKSREAERLAAEKAEAERRAEMDRRHAARAKKHAAQQDSQGQSSGENEDKSEEDLIREHNERLTKIYAKHEARKLAKQVQQQTAHWAKQQRHQRQRSDRLANDGDRQRRESQEQEAYAQTLFCEESTKDKSSLPADSSKSPPTASSIQDDHPITPTTPPQHDKVRPSKEEKPASTTKTQTREEVHHPTQEPQVPRQEQESHGGLKTAHRNCLQEQTHDCGYDHINKTNKRKAQATSARTGALREFQRRQNRKRNENTKTATTQTPKYQVVSDDEENLDSNAAPFVMPHEQPIPGRQQQEKEHRNMKRAREEETDTSEESSRKPSKRMTLDSEAQDTAREKLEHVHEAQQSNQTYYQAYGQTSSPRATGLGDQGSFKHEPIRPININTRYLRNDQTPCFAAYGGIPQEPLYPSLYSPYNYDYINNVQVQTPCPLTPDPARVRAWN